MANEPPTGLFFRSKLGTPEMRTKLQEKMPEFNWRCGDSDLYSYYYVVGKRPDGLKVKITPEDEPDEYYLGVYFSEMAIFPQPKEELAIAQQIHEELLLIVGGMRKT